ncbi:MAG: hypothetical protein JW841_04160 [Deltaproteobacteria bacterium]|nr:hypothetical protein [Deltaproteobacteria bacterium]
MAEIKATAVCFIKQKLRDLGGDAESAFIKTLPVKAAEIYKTVLPLSWIPTDIAAIIYKQGAKTLYPGNHNDCLRQLGFESCRVSYTGIYRLLIRISTIPFLLEQAARIWSNHYNKGQVVAQRLSAKTAVFIVRDYPDLNDTLAEVISGYICALCELSGEKDPYVKRENTPSEWRWMVNWS